MQKKGFFITLEGGEGTGKSTLLRALVDYFNNLNYQIVTTREPGGTIGAEAIRDLLVKGEANRWNTMSEICLFYAAREDHIKRLIEPSIEQGKIVICDRFFDSTRAYQGDLNEREELTIATLEKTIVGPCLPNLTLILDIDVEIGLKRAKSRQDNEGRFEAKTLEYHKKLRNSFLNIAKNEPNRCKVIDASQSAEIVANIAIKHIENLFITGVSND
jgi:dTMP kinase